MQTQETKEQTFQKEKKGVKEGESAAPHTEVCLICIQKHTFHTVTGRGTGFFLYSKSIFL